MVTRRPNEVPPFAALLLAPFACFLLGGILIYLMDTPWQFAPNGIAHAVLWGLGSGLFVYLLLSILTRFPVARSLKTILRQLRPLFKDLRFWQIAVLALMAGLGEEVFFRGFLQAWLSGFITVELAIAVAAIVFGLLHFASVSYFLLTTLLGFALGYVYALTNSLLLIIAWHGFYDLIAIWILSRYPKLLGLHPS